MNKHARSDVSTRKLGNPRALAQSWSAQTNHCPGAEFELALPHRLTFLHVYGRIFQILHAKKNQSTSLCTPETCNENGVHAKVGASPRRLCCVWHSANRNGIMARSMGTWSPPWRPEFREVCHVILCCQASCRVFAVPNVAPIAAAKRVLSSCHLAPTTEAWQSYRAL